MTPSLPQPFTVLIGGIMGSGKTTLGQWLSYHLTARGLQVVHIDIDDVARIHAPPLEGDSAYRALQQTCATILLQRIPLIVSATFRDKHTRDAYLALAEGHAYACVGVFLVPPQEEAIERAMHRSEGHLLSVETSRTKTEDWSLRFSLGDQGDLYNPPWRIYEGLPTPEELTDTTLSRLEFAFMDEPERPVGSHSKEQ